MAVSLFSKHLHRKNLPQNLARRNHMVIAHGLLGSCNNWNTSSDMLLHHTAGPTDAPSSCFPSVTDIFQVDMRNHGQSPHTPTHHTTLMASDLEAFVMNSPALNTTLHDRVIMVGHSMGGIAVMHSLIRRANADYYCGGDMVPSTADEVEIRDSLQDVDADPRVLNSDGGKRAFYGRPSTSSTSLSLPPRVQGAIIVDIPPMQVGRSDKLGSVRSIVSVMAGMDLSRIHTSKEGDAALKAAGIHDPHMRMFLLTNMVFEGGGGGGGGAAGTTHDSPRARWRCNIEALHNDLNQILIPDADPATTPGMRKVSDVPVLFVFGTKSEYFKSLERVEKLIDKYFDRSACVEIKVLEGCDHYPHYQAPRRYVETVHPFITSVFGRE